MKQGIPYLIITAAVGFITFFLFSKYGVMEVNDSARYIEYATNLSNGFYFDQHNFWYFGYAFFIFIVRLISRDIMMLIVAQYAISYLAILSLYRTSFLLFKDIRTALVTVACFILFIEIPTWNAYILAESLYISFTCFSLYALVLFKSRPSALRLIKALIVVLFTALIKPTGIAILAASAMALLYDPIQNLRSVWIRLSIVVVSIVMVLVLANRMLVTFNVIENYQKGEVIYDVTTLPPDAQYESLVVHPPDQLYVPDDRSQPLVRIVSFIFHHPLYWARLFLTKLFYFLVHVRPFWSMGHNLFTVMFLLPAYYFLARSFRREPIEMVVKIFAFAYLGIHVISVCTTSEDWDGRFLMPLLPVVFLLAANGFVSQYSRHAKVL